MRLQLNLDLAVDVRHVGKLALLGTASRYLGEGKRNTIATFLLAFQTDAPLAEYFNPQGGFRPGTLLYAIFVGEGSKVIKSVYNSNECSLVFSGELEGELRNPQKYLHAIARKLLKELQEIEDNELSVEEDMDQLNWAQNHYGLTSDPGVMPDFSRPRHV